MFGKQKTDTAAPGTYEYKTVRITCRRKKQDREINKWTAQGWEYVEIRPDHMLRGWDYLTVRRERQ